MRRGDREESSRAIRGVLEELGEGFLTHPESENLRQALDTGLLDAVEYCGQLICLIFRLLFLFVLEACGRPLPPWQDVRAGRGSDGRDMWARLLATFGFVRSGATSTEWEAPLFDTHLFSADACPHLEAAMCDDARLKVAMAHLSRISGERERRPVAFSRIDVIAVGFSYTSLLDPHPQVAIGAKPSFRLTDGSKRKHTGAFYTPPSLVGELLRSTLVPVLRERVAGCATMEERERAVLAMRVCDPASGSGALLVPAARLMARTLARIRGSMERRASVEYRRALADVIGGCIYAVDKDPVALDLCKLALWVEAGCPPEVCQSLDRHVWCGDSLVGVIDTAVLHMGIPPRAYSAVTGDDKEIAAEILRRSRLSSSRGVSREQRVPGDDGATLKTACDMWTAAFFSRLDADNLESGGVPTVEATQPCLEGASPGVDRLVKTSRQLAWRHRFFHWPLQFPEVFGSGGFDVVLANPPWDILQSEERMFFEPGNRRSIGRLAGQDRKTAISALSTTDPQLAARWSEHRRSIEAEVKFIRESGRYPLSAAGKLNTYSLFTEMVQSILHGAGRAGCIVPSGLITDDSTKRFFQQALDSGKLLSLYHFDNRRRLFPGVGSAVTFCLLTLQGEMRRRGSAICAFFLHDVKGLHSPGKRFRLTRQDVALLNPNTRTCPIFRTARDAEHAKSIYRRVPILRRRVRGESGTEANPWGVELRQGLFNMTSDSYLFYTRAQLEGEGLMLQGNVFTGEQGDEERRFLPLYEAKMMHHYDHRWSHVGSEGHRYSALEKDDPHFSVLPRYWVPETEVVARMRRYWNSSWTIGCRLICRSTDERTVIGSILPQAGYGNSVILLFPSIADPPKLACFLASLNSYVLDYVARQKLGGINLNFHVLEQLPVLPPSAYDRPVPWQGEESLDCWILRRVLELVYTTWDLTPCARYLGHRGTPFQWDEDRRFLIRCEIEVAYFHLYGMGRDDIDAVMESFPILRKKDEARFGRYRTKHRILQLYDAMLDRAMDARAR